MGSRLRKQRTVRARGVVYQAILGFLFGFCLLHPISMVIFHWLDPRFADGMNHVAGNSTFGTALYSFDSSMFPMGFVYGLLVSLIAVVNGYHRATIQNQRDVLKMRNEQLNKLERTNRRNTRFLVHDLRTHLGCILGFSDLLLNQEDPNRTKESEDALFLIRRQSLVMKGRINELLHFARLQETNKIHRENLSALDLFHVVIENFSPLEPGRAVMIGEKVKCCPPVWGERLLLERVLVNLVTNSLKHNRGNIQVSLDAEGRKEDSEVLFSVIDNGGGIPAELKESVFEEFTTNDEGENESTGLGLAFCKTAVEAHGGRIWCDSNGHGGARFCFTVPTKEEVQE